VQHILQCILESKQMCIARARFKVLTQVVVKLQVVWHVTLLCK